MLNRIKKNDTVVVISGKEKGKKGSVIAIDHKSGRVMVKNVAIVTRHKKAKKQGDKSGILKEERFLALNIVMPICSSCKKACRVQVKHLENKKKTRMCHRCKEAF